MYARDDVIKLFQPIPLFIPVVKSYVLSVLKVFTNFWELITHILLVHSKEYTILWVQSVVIL